MMKAWNLCLLLLPLLACDPTPLSRVGTACDDDAECGMNGVCLPGPSFPAGRGGVCLCPCGGVAGQCVRCPYDGGPGGAGPCAEGSCGDPGAEGCASCAGCLQTARASCDAGSCAEEEATLGSCAAREGCTDDACLSERCGPEQDARNACSASCPAFVACF